MRGVRGDYLEDGFSPGEWSWQSWQILVDIWMYWYFWTLNSLFLFLFYLLNYKSIITHLQETWKIQSKVTYSSTMCVNVQSPSHVWLFVTPWTAARQASLSLIISQSLPKFLSIESVMPSNHFIFCCPLLLLPSIHYIFHYILQLFLSR